MKKLLKIFVLFMLVSSTINWRNIAIIIVKRVCFKESTIGSRFKPGRAGYSFNPSELIIRI